MKAFAAVWIFATVILIWGEAFNKARGWHPRNYLEDYDPRYSGTYTGSCKTTYSYTLNFPEKLHSSSWGLKEGHELVVASTALLHGRKDLLAHNQLPFCLQCL
jgi:hypothetical protein